MTSVPSNQLPLPSPSLNLFSAGVLLSMVTRIRVARTTVVLWRWACIKRRSQSNPSVSWRASAKLEQIWVVKNRQKFPQFVILNRVFGVLSRMSFVRSFVNYRAIEIWNLPQDKPYGKKTVKPHWESYKTEIAIHANAYRRPTLLFTSFRTG